MALAIHLGIIIGIFFILSLGLNLAVGFTGLLNFGFIAFYGLGAYTSALLSLRWGLPFWLTLLAGGLLAALAGAALTRITARLKGDYLAMATLSFAYIFSSVALNWRALTRGPLGLPGIPRPEVFGFTFSSNWSYLLFVWGLAIAIFFLLRRLTTSRYGKLLQAVRDDELGAVALGKPALQLKVQSMALATGLAGLAGALFAHYITYIDPSTFFLSDVIVIYTIIIVGGLASLPGTWLASVVVILVPELLRFLLVPAAIVGPARLMFYAMILLAIVLIKPRGFFGKVELE